MFGGVGDTEIELVQEIYSRTDLDDGSKISMANEVLEEFRQARIRRDLETLEQSFKVTLAISSPLTEDNYTKKLAKKLADKRDNTPLFRKISLDVIERDEEEMRKLEKYWKESVD